MTTQELETILKNKYSPISSNTYLEKKLSRSYLIREYFENNNSSFKENSGYFTVKIVDDNFNSYALSNLELVYNIIPCYKNEYIEGIHKLFNYLSTNLLTIEQRLDASYIDNFNLDECIDVAMIVKSKNNCLFSLTLKDLIFIINSIALSEDIKFNRGSALGRKLFETALYDGLVNNKNKVDWYFIFSSSYNDLSDSFLFNSLEKNKIKSNTSSHYTSADTIKYSNSITCTWP